MALTADDISNVQRTWAEVYKDPAANGSVILKTFLDKYDYYGKFPKFKGVPNDSITENAVYKNHVVKLMGVLDKAFNNLNNVGELKTMLVGLGQAHKKRKIEELQFQQLKEVILGILVKVFKISKDEKASWEKTLGIAFPLIYEGLNS